MDAVSQKSERDEAICEIVNSLNPSLPDLTGPPLTRNDVDEFPLEFPLETPVETQITHDPLLYEDRKRLIMEQAYVCLRSQVSWQQFFRIILSTEGMFYRLLNTPELRDQFRRSTEHKQLIETLHDLYRNASGGGRVQENVRVITVRLPASLHAWLLAEAARRNTSLNRLCISELLPKPETSILSETPLPIPQNSAG